MDLGCGITFDIFTHVFFFYTGFTQVYYNISIHTKKKKKNTSGDLGEGYNVELKKNRFTAHSIIR